VDKNHVTAGISFRPLFLDQHAGLRISPVETAMNRVPAMVEAARPEMCGNREQVRIPEQGDKGAQTSRLTCPGGRGCKIIARRTSARPDQHRTHPAQGEIGRGGERDGVDVPVFIQPNADGVVQALLRIRVKM
jgi:hypothetical protein